MLEVDHGGGKIRKTTALEAEEVDAGVVLELVRFDLDVEEG